MTEQLTYADIASLVGLDTRSIREYRRRGTLPEPDGHLGRTPWWHRETVEHWMSVRRRPGRPSQAKVPT